MTDLPRALRLHPELAVVEGPPARLWHTETARLEALAPEELGALLHAFVRPRAVQEVIAELEANQAAPSHEPLAILVERCVRAGLLVEPAAP
jgi:hypothetical protein